MSDFDYGYERGWWGSDGIPYWIDDTEHEDVKPVEIEQKEIEVTDVAVRSPKITVFGVGHGGCALLNLLADSDLGDRVKLVAVDNEEDGVMLHNVDTKIALHKGVRSGLHQPFSPQRATDGALEVYDEILDAMKWKK